MAEAAAEIMQTPPETERRKPERSLTPEAEVVDELAELEAEREQLRREEITRVRREVELAREKKRIAIEKEQEEENASGTYAPTHLNTRSAVI